MSDHIDDAKRLEVEERVNVSFEIKSDDEGFNSVREIIDQAMNAAKDANKQERSE